MGTTFRKPRRLQSSRRPLNSALLLSALAVLLLSTPVARPMVTCLVTGDVQVAPSSCCEAMASCQPANVVEHESGLHADAADVGCNCCVVAFDRLTGELERSRRPSLEMTGPVGGEPLFAAMLPRPRELSPRRGDSLPPPRGAPDEFLTLRLLI